MTRSSPSSRALTDEKTSILLRRVLAELPGGKVSVGYIMLQLRRRSFGGILIFLAALGLLPGLSLFAGLAMIMPALQMIVGFRTPFLPRFIRQREIESDRVRALGNKAIPWIEQIERVVKPRWLVLTQPPMPAIIGIFVIALALVLIVPLPFSNLPPAVALICFSFGLLERDGLMILIGLATAAVALTIGVSITYVAVEAVTLFLGEQFG